MTRWKASTLGRWSLRLDAAYCALLGVAVALGAGLIAEGLVLPPLVITSVGITVAIWSVGIAWMLLSRLRLRAVLTFVMTVNLIAALAVTAVSVLAASPLMVLAVLAVAVDILLFAASQATALRGLTSTQRHG